MHALSLFGRCQRQRGVVYRLSKQSPSSSSIVSGFWVSQDFPSAEASREGRMPPCWIDGTSRLMASLADAFPTGLEPG